MPGNASASGLCPHPLPNKLIPNQTSAHADEGLSFPFESSGGLCPHPQPNNLGPNQTPAHADEGLPFTLESSGGLCPHPLLNEFGAKQPLAHAVESAPLPAPQRKRTLRAAQPDQIFTAFFYQPYRIAVEAALAMLCHTRQLLNADMGAESIQRMTFRLKTPRSICDKLRKKQLPITCDAAGAALHDIAGLRVVFTNIDAVYRYAALLTASPLAEFISSRDYIAQPKRSGYRSLHLLMVVPILCQGQHMLVPIEIQLRTAPMDAWAVIEHDVFYKPAANAGERMRLAEM